MYLHKKMLNGLLTVAEAAEQYGVHPATVRRWIDRGLVPAYRVGERRIGIKASDLAKVVKPRAASHARRAPTGAIAIPQRMTKEEQERGRRALERIDRLRAELAAKYGKFTPESWVLINDARDLRTRQLLGEDVKE